jgi:ketosteroid isomerase-like protein
MMISRKILKNQEILATLDRYWEATLAHDLERAHGFYHDDVVVEFPQSGERILGKRNIYELRAHYPAKVTFKILRVRGEGNLWITELVITYDGGRPVHAVGVMEFRDGKIAHETHYYADPFEPPEWRSQWVERIKLPDFFPLTHESQI